MYIWGILGRAIAPSCLPDYPYVSWRHFIKCSPTVLAIRSENRDQRKVSDDQAYQVSK